MGLGTLGCWASSIICQSLPARVELPSLCCKVLQVLQPLPLCAHCPSEFPTILHQRFPGSAPPEATGTAWYSGSGHHHCTRPRPGHHQAVGCPGLPPPAPGMTAGRRPPTDNVVCPPTARTTTVQGPVAVVCASSLWCCQLPSSIRNLHSLLVLRLQRLFTTNITNPPSFFFFLSLSPHSATVTTSRPGHRLHLVSSPLTVPIAERIASCLPLLLSAAVVSCCCRLACLALRRIASSSTTPTDRHHVVATALPVQR